MQTTKKVLALLLAALLACGTLAMTANAAGYTVTWKNWNGAVLETDTGVEDGTMPSYNSAAPTKPAVGTLTYAFAGWNKEIIPVTGDVTFTAVFRETDTSGITTWRSGMSLSALKQNDILRPGAGFSFSAGNANVILAASRHGTDTEVITTDTVVIDTYDTASVSIEGASDGVRFTRVLNKGNATWTNLRYPTDDAGHVNAGNAWKVLSATVENGVPRVVLGGTIYPINHTYTVTWRNADGDVLYYENVAEEANASYAGTPLTKAEDENYRYILYWSDGVKDYADGHLPMTVKDVTYTAVFKAVPKFEGKIFSAGDTIDFSVMTYVKQYESSSIMLSGEQTYTGTSYSLKNNFYSVNIGGSTIRDYDHVTYFGANPKITFIGGDGLSAATAYKVVCLGAIFDGATFASGDYIDFTQTGTTVGGQTLVGAVGISAVNYNAETSECTLSMTNGMTLPVTVEGTPARVDDVRILWDAPDTYHFEAVSEAIKVGDIYYNGDYVDFGAGTTFQIGSTSYTKSGPFKYQAGTVTNRGKANLYLFAENNDQTDIAASFSFSISLYTSIRSKYMGLYVSSGSGTASDPYIMALAYDTVTWKNYDGTVLEASNTVASGTAVTYTGESPVKAGTDVADFTFAGWTDGSGTVYTSETLPVFSGTVTYTAVFDYTLKTTPDTEQPDQQFVTVDDQISLTLSLDLGARGVGTDAVSITLAGKDYDAAVTASDTEGVYNYKIEMAPAQIADLIVVTIDGDENPLETSVKAYCDTLSASSAASAKDKALALAILNYGQAANNVFLGGADEIANLAGMNKTAVQSASVTFNDGTGKVTGASFMALTKPEFRFYTANIDEQTAYDYNEAGVSATIANGGDTLNARFVKKADGKVLLEVTGVTAENMDKVITVTVTGLGTITFNGNAFAKAMASSSNTAQSDLGAALYNYGAAANACFGA